MQVVEGKKIHQVDRQTLEERLGGYDEVAIDLGTGDGKFVLDRARKNPQTFWIGVDAVRDAMQRSSRRAASKPARGGAENALYVLASVEQLPAELAGLADLVTVNFPWGSLLRAVTLPEPVVLQGIVALARPGARFVALINYSVFEDEAYRERLGLPALEFLADGEALAEAYGAAGIEVTERVLLRREVPHRTSWGQRLILGSDRATLLIEGRFAPPAGKP